jgi:F0F1-type ATP synthase membrane subunit b/b'
MISMHLPQVFDWLVTLINFGIMFMLFRLVVIVPMEQAVKLREQRVKLRLQEIEQIAADAKARQEEFEAKFSNVDAMLSEIKSNSERLLAQAKAKADEKAEAEERYLLQKAEAEAASLRHEVEKEIRTRVAGQAVARAEALLASALDSATQNAIVSAGVKKVGELRAT